MWVTLEALLSLLSPEFKKKKLSFIAAETRSSFTPRSSIKSTCLEKSTNHSSTVAVEVRFTGYLKSNNKSPEIGLMITSSVAPLNKPHIELNSGKTPLMRRSKKRKPNKSKKNRRIYNANM